MWWRVKPLKGTETALTTVVEMPACPIQILASTSSLRCPGRTPAVCCVHVSLKILCLFNHVRTPCCASCLNHSGGTVATMHRSSCDKSRTKSVSICSTNVPVSGPAALWSIRGMWMGPWITEIFHNKTDAPGPHPAGRRDELGLARNCLWQQSRYEADMHLTAARSEVTSLATPVFCLGHGFIQTNADISHLHRQVPHNPGTG